MSWVYQHLRADEQGGALAVLHGSSEVVHADGVVNGDGSLDIYVVTPVGLCCVRKAADGSWSKRGYVDASTLGVTIKAVAAGAEGVDRRIYFGTSAGAYKLAATDFADVADSDATGDCVKITFPTTSYFNTAAITRIAYGTNGTQKRIAMQATSYLIGIADPDDGFADFRSTTPYSMSYGGALWSDGESPSGMTITPEGDLVVSRSGGVLLKRNIFSVSADFEFDRAYCSMGFESASMATIPDRLQIPNYDGSADYYRSLVFGKICLGFIASGNRDVYQEFGHLHGDFDLQLIGIGGTLPGGIVNYGKLLYRYLYVTFSDGTHSRIRFLTYTGSGGIKRQFQWAFWDGAAYVLQTELFVSDGDEGEAGGFRLKRVGGTIYAYYQYSGGSTGSGWVAFPVSSRSSVNTGPVYVHGRQQLSNVTTGDNVCWKISSLTNSGAEVTLPDAATEFPTDLLVKAVAAKTVSDTLLLAASFAGGGVRLFSPNPTDSGAIDFSETYGTTGFGATREIIASDDVACLAFEAEETSTNLLVGHESAGLDYVRDLFGTPATTLLTMAEGELVSDTVRAILVLASFFAVTDEGGVYGADVVADEPDEEIDTASIGTAPSTLYEYPSLGRDFLLDRTNPANDYAAKKLLPQYVVTEAFAMELDLIVKAFRRMRRDFFAPIAENEGLATIGRRRHLTKQPFETWAEFRQRFLDEWDGKQLDGKAAGITRICNFWGFDVTITDGYTVTGPSDCPNLYWAEIHLELTAISGTVPITQSRFFRELFRRQRSTRRIVYKIINGGMRTRGSGKRGTGIRQDYAVFVGSLA